MYKFSFSIIFLLFAYTVCAKSYDASQLPIVVRNIPEWSNEYPTVINNWKGLMVKSYNGELPPLLAVVITINGKDTKGMDENTFNTLLMAQGRSTIEYLVKDKGQNIKKQCEIKYHPSIYWAEGITMDNPTPFTEDIVIKNIKNASVFNFNTFAFNLGNVEDVDESAVLEAASKALQKVGFAKSEDTNNADKILSLSKGRDENNGYKITFNIIDGKKLKDGIERVLWTLDVCDLTSNIKSHESAVKTALYKYCTNFPFDLPVYSTKITTLGIAFESKEAIPTGNILDVLPGTDAYNKGLRGGNAILGAYAGYTCANLLYTKTRRYYFKPNHNERQKNWGVDLLLILPIIPQFTYNNAYHYLSDSKWRGGVDSKKHFKVRNSYGQKTTMDAPFEESTINLKYIR